MTGFSINNLTTTIFQQLTFELTTPGLYGMIGPNGIGKSTLEKSKAEKLLTFQA